jgi:sulfatase maturation enzyme AslB (radical SAM superfamily)
MLTTLDQSFNESLVTSYHRQVVISRDIDNNLFAFVPLLCSLYKLSDNDLFFDVPTGLDSCYVIDSTQIPSIHNELLEEIKLRSLKSLHRHHEAGIAVILTQSCNLSCSYCLAKQGTFGLPVVDMKEDDIKQRLKMLFDANPHINFVKFFGGEPTLRMDLIESICKFVTEDLQRKVCFAITTNGTQDPKHHIETWKRFHVSVSVSIDGPEEIHDQERKTASGRGSFKQAMSYCQALKDANFPFAVVSVFDERHLQHGMKYLDVIRFLNTISPLSKVQFLESLGDATTVYENYQFDLEIAKSQIYEAVDTIMYQISNNWISPKNTNWLYDNNIFRFLNGIVTSKAVPYEHACTASNLTTLFPSGLSTPCYTFSEKPDLALGQTGDSLEVLEKNRQAFRDTHNWEYLSELGTNVPWYRGVVGDICVADMMNSSSSSLQSSPFYKCFQTSTVLRVLQHLSSINKTPIKHMRLLSALEEHRIITGQYVRNNGKEDD